MQLPAPRFGGLGGIWERSFRTVVSQLSCSSLSTARAPQLQIQKVARTSKLVIANSLFISANRHFLFSTQLCQRLTGPRAPQRSMLQRASIGECTARLQEDVSPLSRCSRRCPSRRLPRFQRQHLQTQHAAVHAHGVELRHTLESAQTRDSARNQSGQSVRPAAPKSSPAPQTETQHVPPPFPTDAAHTMSIVLAAAGCALSKLRPFLSIFTHSLSGACLAASVSLRVTLLCRRAGLVLLEGLRRVAHVDGAEKRKKKRGQTAAGQQAAVRTRRPQHTRWLPLGPATAASLNSLTCPQESATGASSESQPLQQEAPSPVGRTRPPVAAGFTSGCSPTEPADERGASPEAPRAAPAVTPLPQPAELPGRPWCALP